jgi:hypothetical protein
MNRIVPDTNPNTTTDTTDTLGWGYVTAAMLRSAAGTINARGHRRLIASGATVLSAIRESARSLYPGRAQLAEDYTIDALAKHLGTDALGAWEKTTSPDVIVSEMRTAADTLSSASKLFGMAA